MPKQKITPTQEPPLDPAPEAAMPEQKGRPIPPEAAALIAEMAARGRARRREIEAQGTPPWEAAKRDPEWQKRWDELLARVRSEIPEGLTPEEIEAEITRASEEVRNERLVRGR